MRLASACGLRAPAACERLRRRRAVKVSLVPDTTIRCMAGIGRCSLVTGVYRVSCKAFRTPLFNSCVKKARATRSHLDCSRIVPRGGWLTRNGDDGSKNLLLHELLTAFPTTTSYLSFCCDFYLKGVKQRIARAPLLPRWTRRPKRGLLNGPQGDVRRRCHSRHRHFDL